MNSLTKFSFRLGLLVAACFFLSACCCLFGQDSKENSAPPDTATPPTQPTAQTPQISDTTRVVVLCYHRFEEKPRDGLAISPQAFEQQMKDLKTNGIEVISMDDFLAWRRGEKTLPPKCALITIDDGYVSCYTLAWPLLKKLGLPFTMFVYIDYMRGGARSGGASMSWEQLAEMAAAGVEVGSHSVTHAFFTKPLKRTPAEYLAWLDDEMIRSKEIIEKKIGKPIRTIAYPYGSYNDAARTAAASAGYEAAFTVKGTTLAQTVPAMECGRYAIESNKPATFAATIAAFNPLRSLAGTASADPCPYPTIPADRQPCYDELPEINLDLSSLESKILPSTISMTVSGLGEVPSRYDSAKKTLSYQIRNRLYSSEVTVSVSFQTLADTNKKTSFSWTYYPATNY